MLADEPNTIPRITSELARSMEWTVLQRWQSVGTAAPPAHVAGVVSEQITELTPKFTLLNRELARHQLQDYEYVIVSDDDILLPPGFLDRFLSVARTHRLALCQPARTHDSFIDHPFVEQLDGLDARWTRFVEIGPLFAVHRSVADLILPFDESSPMGWGYDMVWPCLLERHGTRMGIVDAVPVSHSLRAPVVNYEHALADTQMTTYLSKYAHLSPEQAFTIIESYA
jgi:hypothetical protein